MALTFGTNLGLLVNGNIGEVHYNELMAFFRGVDCLVMPHAKSITVTAQPGSPANGDIYIVPTGATGTPWSTNVGKIARYSTVTAAWQFFTPLEGWTMYVEDTDHTYRYSGSAWVFMNGQGTTANRPASGITGAEYFNTTTGIPNWYSGSGWVNSTGGAV